MTRNITNYGKSIRAKILNVSKANNILFQTLLTRYFQERLLYRMAISPYRGQFYLKGGALMYAYERFSARPTLDIDFLGESISNDEENIMATFKEICAIECEQDGVRFDTESITAKRITEFKDYHGVRISLMIKMDTISQQMTMDIGFGDVVTPAPVDLDYPLLIDELPGVNILAYSVETVIAEKFHAVVDLADRSSRMKDYYDLYRLLLHQQPDSEKLQEAINATFINRHTPHLENVMLFQPDFGKNERMLIQWKAFTRRLKVDLDFEAVIDTLQKKLYPYWVGYGG